MNSSRFREIFKYVVLWVLTPLLTSLFLFIGTPLLRVFERVYGQRLYWFTGAILLMACAAAGFLDLVCIFTAMWICQGLYGFFERIGRGGMTSSLVSVVAGVAAFFLSLVSMAGAENLKKLPADTEEAFGQIMAQLHMSDRVQVWGFDLQPSTLLQLLPFLIATVVLLGFACSLMLDRRVAQLVGLRFNQAVSSLKLLQLRLPPGYLWVFLVTALVALMSDPGTILKTVCLNISCFLFVVYFFQGLAVFEAGLLFFRIGPLIRILLYIVVVGNLFFLLSLLGIADFWLDFRKRMKREKRGHQS